MESGNQVMNDFGDSTPKPRRARATVQKASKPWEKFLVKPEERDHIVQVSPDLKFLTQSVALFLGTGLKRKEAAIVIASDAHWKTFAKKLTADGFDVEGAMRTGQLNVLDAEKTLAQIMQGEMPDWELFKKTIESAIDHCRSAGKCSSLRAYGEIVDLLYHQGKFRAAVRLEEFWNTLAETHGFSLFCAYTIDPLDHQVMRGPLRDICKTHSHLIPTEDYHRLENALHQVSQEVLGSSLSDLLSALSDRHPYESTKMPNAQAILFWMQENMPFTSEKILWRMRAMMKPAA